MAELDVTSGLTSGALDQICARHPRVFVFWSNRYENRRRREAKRSLCGPVHGEEPEFLENQKHASRVPWILCFDQSSFSKSIYNIARSDLLFIVIPRIRSITDKVTGTGERQVLAWDASTSALRNCTIYRLLNWSPTGNIFIKFSKSANLDQYQLDTTKQQPTSHNPPQPTSHQE